MTTLFRRSLHVQGLGHGRQPIPMGSRVGNMIFTSNITGRNPATGELAQGAQDQARQALDNLQALLAGEGATMQNVGLVEVIVKNDAHREAFNAAWIVHFPDAESRPARHTSVDPDIRGEGALLHIRAIAVLV